MSNDPSPPHPTSETVEQQILDQVRSRLKAETEFPDGMADRLYELLSSEQKVKSSDLVALFKEEEK